MTARDKMKPELFVQFHDADGLVTKEMHIPAGTVMGKEKHSYSHQSFLGKGTVRLHRDDTSEVLKAPAIIEVKAGVWHTVEAITDVVWFCTHSTDQADIHDNFKKTAADIDVGPLLREVLAQPELWNKNPCRLSPRGPHHETQDMFLRYKDETDNLRNNDWKDFADPHLPDWNKTIDFLPAARKLIFDLMTSVSGEMLGGVFLYKVEPGKQIYPHTDKGWHPEFYDKYNICLQSNPKAAFCYEGEKMVQKQGDIHFFQNNVQHWVVNKGDTDHIVLTVCIRRDRGYRVPWSPEGWTLDGSMERNMTNKDMPQRRKVG